MARVGATGVTGGGVSDRIPMLACFLSLGWGWKEGSMSTSMPTMDQVETLIQPGSRPRVSMYMPTHEAGSAIRQDPIRLKNRLSEGRAQLRRAGLDDREIARLLDPVEARCDLDTASNRDFWRHQSRGLAVLVSAERVLTFRLAEPVEELTTVGNRYHVTPLIRAIQRDERYDVLAVSQNRVRVLEGSRAGLRERPAAELPRSLQEVFQPEHPKGFNLHSFRVQPGAEDAAVPHGHVEPNRDHKLRRYVQRIEAALGDVLGPGAPRPLVFAGVEELWARFREVAGHRFLVDPPLLGNPDERTPDALHEEAWPRVADLERS